MVAPVEAAQSVGRGIGRHFAVVSMLPALVLASWLVLLTVTGAWVGAPQLDRLAGRSATQLFGDGVLTLLLALVLALVLHPFVFATTQFLEGYWGVSPLGIGAMRLRIVHHRRRLRVLRAQADRYERAWRAEAKRISQRLFDADPRGRVNPATASPEMLSWLVLAPVENDLGDPLMSLVAGAQEAQRRTERLPAEARRVMPTRLGNTLRAFEDGLGRPYGITDGIRIVPHLQLVAPPAHVEILRDARTAMDRAARLCTIWLLAAAATGLALLTDGWWLFLALVPYAFAYLSYRGAIAGAREYATAVKTILDVDRFLLYEQLRLEQPSSHRAERSQNAELVPLLTGDDDISLRYRDPPAGAPAGGGAPPG